jgi:glutathione S-transferase
MTIKIHGLAMSTCTKRVLTTLKEKGLDFELVPVDFGGGEHKSEKFREKQPFGVIPYLEDDGFIIYESRAICKYLEQKYKGKGTTLIPEDAQGYGIFEQGCSIELSYFDPNANPIVGEKVFKPMFYNAPPDEEKVKQLSEKLASHLDTYEKILSKQDYIGGNTFTLADIFHLPYGSMVQLPNVGFASLFNDRPHVKAWWDRITSRASWQEVSKMQ